MSKTTTTLSDYEVFNHKILWGVAKRNLKVAQNTRKSDSMFWALGSMILTYSAFEGYLNWLGETIDPQIWRKERQFFNNPPYKGTLGKYIYLSKILGLPEPCASKGPFQSVKELSKLRNLSIHSKKEKGKKEIKHKAGSFPPPYKSNLEKKVSVKKAEKVVNDVNSLCKKLHNAAKTSHNHLVRDKKPFDMILGFESGTEV